MRNGLVKVKDFLEMYCGKYVTVIDFEDNSWRFEWNPVLAWAYNERAMNLYVTNFKADESGLVIFADEVE